MSRSCRDERRMAFSELLACLAYDAVRLTDKIFDVMGRDSGGCQARGVIKGRNV